MVARVQETVPLVNREDGYSRLPAQHIYFRRY